MRLSFPCPWYSTKHKCFIYLFAVVIIKEEQVISAPSVRNWNENGVILLDRGRKWEALGLALAQKQTSKDLSNLFENLLRAKDGSEVLQRLRDLGVPESAIEDLEIDFKDAAITDVDDIGPRTKKESVQEEETFDKNKSQEVPQEEKNVKKTASQSSPGNQIRLGVCRA